MYVVFWKKTFNLSNFFHSQKTYTHRFAESSFNFWDFNKYRKKQVFEQKQYVAEVSLFFFLLVCSSFLHARLKHSISLFFFVIFQSFKLLLQSHEIQNLMLNRTRKERYLLYARRGFGVILNIAFLVASWIAVCLTFFCFSFFI